MTFLFLGEIILVIFVFIFYFVPDAREKLGLFPEKAMKDAIEKYGVVDDDDMVNLIDGIQRSVSLCYPLVNSLSHAIYKTYFSVEFVNHR